MKGREGRGREGRGWIWTALVDMVWMRRVCGWVVESGSGRFHGSTVRKR